MLLKNDSKLWDRFNVYIINRIKEFKKLKIIYLFAFICIAHVIIFSYIPMYGIIIAFKRYKLGAEFLGGDWVGLRYFIQFFNSMVFWRIIKNTLLLGVYSLIFSFPAPIILALIFNEIKGQLYKRISQTISYMPYFISTVIIVGLLKSFFSSTGFFNDIRILIGLDRINFIADPAYFRTLYIASGIWQGVGFGTIIYLAALSGIDTQILEAAVIDGANRLHRILYVSIPSIMPTIVILLILSAGSIINVGFEKVFLMQTPTNMVNSDVIATYVYRMGIVDANYSFATAVGLFNAVISFILLAAVNLISKRVTETSLW